MKTSHLKSILPLALFAGLALTLWLGLRHDPSEALPSARVGKPVPAFSLPRLSDAEARFSPVELKGQVWLLNVWASWCQACREEHPVLLGLAQQKSVPLIGLNYQDQREPGLRWLSDHGDPYAFTAVDADGRTGIDLGVYGVPETFLIDKQGRVRLRHAGPLTQEVLEREILPLVKALQRG
ncbi:DsbE family thiol:disulfide interchange protein [Aquabacterium sp.]|uniref:DsbE family thiol:disulfide interchange protein n=1 Tax=Aquabacterium sp. TaxID=1872578 RepID=UPI0025BADDD4|nr:DsbE family thiol:disulfide interchange protein [Aquabacterium sp.]